MSLRYVSTAQMNANTFKQKLLEHTLLRQKNPPGMHVLVGAALDVPNVSLLKRPVVEAKPTDFSSSVGLRCSMREKSGIKLARSSSPDVSACVPCSAKAAMPPLPRDCGDDDDGDDDDDDDDGGGKDDTTSVAPLGLDVVKVA